MSNFIPNKKLVFEDREPPCFDRIILKAVKIKFTKMGSIIKAINI